MGCSSDFSSRQICRTFSLTCVWGWLGPSTRAWSGTSAVRSSRSWPGAIGQPRSENNPLVVNLVMERRLPTVTDKDALAAWLAAQPVESGLYRVKVEQEMRELQRLCSETGEVPPGTDYVPERDEFYVKANSPETAIVKGE